MNDEQQRNATPAMASRGRNRWVAAILGMVPGLGHLYLGRKRLALALFGGTLALGLALWFGPVLAAPGNIRLTLFGPLFFTLIVLPVSITFGVIDAWRLASAELSAGPKEVSADIGRWGWSLCLAGVTSVMWMLTRQMAPIDALVQTTPPVLIAVAAWLLGTGLRRKNVDPDRPIRAGRITAASGLVVAALVGLAAASGGSVGGVLRLWGLIPLAMGVELLVERANWRDGGRTGALGLSGGAELVAIIVLVAGLMAAPLRAWTDFPFTSTLQLPRIFNLGQGAGVAVRDGRAARGNGVTVFTSPQGCNGFRYVTEGSGNIKVVGRADRSDFITDTAVVTVRAASQDAADQLLSRVAQINGGDGEGTAMIWWDDLGELPPRTEVTRDILVEVPSTADIAIDIGFGQVEVVGVSGNVQVRTGFGQINVRDCSGKVVAETGWGDVRVDSASGKVIAATDFGSIYCTADSLKEDSRLAAKVGQVHCRLTGATDIDMVAQTSQGAIRSSVQGRRRARYGQQTLEARFGDGGPQLVIESGFGDITISEGGK